MKLKLILTLILVVLCLGAVWYLNPGNIFGSYGRNPSVNTTNQATSTATDSLAKAPANQTPPNLGVGIMSKGISYSLSGGTVDTDSFSECNSQKTSGATSTVTDFYLEYKNTTGADMTVDAKLLYGAGNSRESEYNPLSVKKNEVSRIAVIAYGCYNSGTIEISDNSTKALISRVEF